MVVQSTERSRADRLQGTCRCIVAVMAAAISPLLLANTITVDDASSGSVPGKCTVQDAFVAANTNVTVNGCAAGSVGVDTIVFAPGITNIVLADRFPPGFGSYGLEAKEDLIVDGGAVAGSGVPVVTITRSNAVGVPVFGMIFASGHGGGGGPSFNFTLKGMKITGAVIAGALLGDNVTVSDSVIDGNEGSSSNGGIRADTLTITDSTVSNNSFGNGAGIAANTLILTNTTVSGNSGDPGGIYANIATLTNATISGNTSAGAGSTAGMSLNGGTLKFVTITGNAITGGAGSVSVGLLYGSVYPVSFSHVVIAGNLGSAGSSDFDARFAQANTILGDHSWIGALGAAGQFSIANGVLIASCASTNFGPLANNGGGKATHALLPGSCLIDAGAACASTPLPFDERGAGFSRCANGALDIGAFESQVAPPPGAQRTFVSGQGLDINACSISAPCRTFAVAISRTAAGGEVVIKDSAGYGPVTISKPISIVAPAGIYAGISVLSGTGIIVSPGSGRVALKGLVISGLGGVHGIDFQSGDVLDLDDVTVKGFGAAGSFGLRAMPSANGQVRIRNSVFSANDTGAGALPPSGTAVEMRIDRSKFLSNAHGLSFGGANTRAVITNSTISSGATGVTVQPGIPGAAAKVEIRNTTIANNSIAGLLMGVMASAPATVSLISSQVAENNAGIAVNSGSAVYVSDTTITRNTTGISVAAGLAVSLGDNRVTGNLTDGSFTSTVGKQ